MSVYIAPTKDHDHTKGLLMSIDPTTLPDGTLVETDAGYPYFKDGDGWQSRRGTLGDGQSYPWNGRTIVRTYTPDPTPDQEVPRDEWANLKPGSRLRIVEACGDEHTVTVERSGVDYLYCENHVYYPASINRIYLLDAPDPDAEAVEVMARAAALEAASALPWEDRSEANRAEWRGMARAALAALREHDKRDPSGVQA